MSGGPREGLFSASALVLFVAAVAGAVWYSPPLRSFRPEQSELWTSRPQQIEQVPARLWEDPLAVIAEARTKQAAPGRGRPLASLLKKELGGRARALKRVRILPVLVPSDNAETRLRTRYAVVTGLAEEGFYPESTDALAVLRVPPPEANDGESEGAEERAELVPVEWFHSETRGALAVVLWIDETAHPGEPLGFVARALDLAGLAPDAGIFEQLEVEVIGPASSNTLLAMMEEVRASADGKEYAGWTVLNCRATAPEALLLDRVEPRADGADCEPRTIREWMCTTGEVNFVRVIGTDDRLMFAIAGELHRRGVDLNDPRSVVVLVSELDTVYGRWLARALSAVLEAARGEGDAASFYGCGLDDARHREELWCNLVEGGPHEAILRLSYLRGLDGAHVDRTKEEDRDERGSLESWDEVQARWKQPVGSSQLDYLRRVAAELEGRAVSPGCRCFERRIDAVGVVGTDVYDKQLALQALRPDLGSALFFSTDLDARLFHRSQYGWTHNLIVASFFGLELAPRLQGRAMTFRDGYQTATFVAARMAVGNAELARLVPPRPRVYELGRSGAWDLGQEADRLHPPPPSVERSGGWRNLPPFVIVAILFIVGSGSLFGRLAKTWRASWGRPTRTWLVLAGGLAATLMLVWTLLGRSWPTSGYGEPFAVFEGISSWPTEVLRVVVVVFSFGALVLGVTKLEENAREIEGEFGLPAKAPEGARASFSWSLGVEGARSVRAEELWGQYRANGRLAPTAVRIGALLVLVFLAVVLVFSQTGMPFVPVRGALARGLDRWLFMMPAWLAFNVLLLFVHDATRECSSLIHRLSDGFTEWPKSGELFKRLDMSAPDAAHVLDVRLVASRTKAVGGLILAPFFALFLLVIARNSFFDAWDWPPGLVALLLLQVAIAFASALRLRHQAERTRRIAVGKLRDAHLRLIRVEHLDSRRRADQVQEAIERAQGLREGAFAPWFRNPAVRALIMPFGGAGAIALVDMFVHS